MKIHEYQAKEVLCQYASHATWQGLIQRKRRPWRRLPKLSVHANIFHTAH